MVFIVLALLVQNEIFWRKMAFLFLILTFLLDGLDGFLARKLKLLNNVGSLIDTLGDRIVENVMLFFFAYNKLIPLLVPLVFISRSFLADFIRFLAFNQGLGDFLINKSKFGFYIVASKFSRAVYLILKFYVFLLGAFIMVDPHRKIFWDLPSSVVLFYSAIILTIVNLLRFTGLLFDAKSLLKETFLQK